MRRNSLIKASCLWAACLFIFILSFIPLGNNTLAIELCSTAQRECIKHSLKNNIQDEYALANVPMIYQNPELPTGCEATAATMLLNAYGYDITKEQVARDLPKGINVDPHVAFCGDPFSSNGFGVFARPMAELMQGYLQRPVRVHEHASEDEILAILDDGRPCMVWATINLLPIVYQSGWTLPNGNAYVFPGNEHCMVLVGYDSTSVTVHDPLRGVVKYDRELFFQRFSEIGGEAIGVVRESW